MIGVIPIVTKAKPPSVVNMDSSQSGMEVAKFCSSASMLKISTN